jgi:hypothetical protein
MAVFLDSSPETCRDCHDRFKYIKHDSPVHEDQRNVGIEGLVEILDLLNRKIQKGEVVSHRDH